MVVKSKKQSKPKAAPVETPPDLDFDDAVKLGKKLAGSFNVYQFELGKLVKRIKPRPEEDDKALLERFGKAIEVPFSTLYRCLSVVRAYHGADFQGTSPSFAAAQALQAHPGRVALLTTKPNMSVREARTIARSAGGKKKKPTSRNDAGTIRKVLELAQQVRKLIGHTTRAHIDALILRDELKNPEQAFDLLHKAEDHFRNLKIIWKDALASLPAPVVSRLDDKEWDAAKPAPSDDAKPDDDATTLAEALEPAE
jgi:hypothetical protein